jgi:transcriptional regulator with XRE-family HTH domain/predicted negative regulator of RcsB-dependent stress response
VARAKPRHIDDPVSVGRRLRAARAAAGLTQRDLAAAGCTAAYVSRIESGARIPSLQLLRAFGELLGVSAEYLATGADAPPVDPVAEADLELRLGNLERAQELYDALAAEGRTAPALLGLGRLASQRGRLDEAIELLSAARDAGAPLREVAEPLARAYAQTARLDEAVAVLESALAAETDEVTRRRFSVLLANALIDLGNLDRAAELLGDGLAQEETTGDPLALARLFWSQSRLHTARGANDLAARHARKALGILDLGEHAEYAARARQVLAFIELERGNAETALRLLEEGWEVAAKAANEELKALLRVERARALVALGRVDEAREDVLALAADSPGLGRFDAARHRATVAALLAKIGEPDLALTLYEEAAAALEDAGTPFAASVYAAWSELLESVGRREEAFEVLKRAVPSRARGALV